ncbi:hypothetical protein [Phaeobacter sp. HF9A]|uniref:hypothetical protein n=1 Tax=Phaeobacter sp. HF9A TaxID=2721561 RepID=UPI0014316CA1|nr:hypothetical protein [Phaeobacter sp. HF9A]NIZ12017.1 hypothetical protein [Phaeobacter sp. HF9A]
MSAAGGISDLLQAVLQIEIDRLDAEADIEADEIADGLSDLVAQRLEAMEPAPPDPALSLAELVPPVDWSSLGVSSATDFIETLVVLNAAMIPGWPFADSMVRGGEVALPVKPVQAEASEEERAQYVASLMAPYRQALTRLRKLLRDLEQLDPAEAEDVFRALMQALGTVAQAVREALDLTEAGRRVAEELALATPSPKGPGSRRRRYRL